ncbi:dihydroneopterin triphosphate pyrophosphatase [Bisgaardia hudsonensis]|uniref:Dihydroneopterin triphosphate pyrophosphatase n=1 Tax=Bisgaardia hudsonensis TaxID=109472 RepID=A0A4R2N062_9PAST|nr:dihydroneopterin triphosphate diphosphatase [Bisgaardia hudsonensis]QLB13354.1 dihydroneopterin triphosphate diphosphatase [Bisgaardia hudsonensis]TCP12755.1 dihydroneopterin triphosphate pyrophosphatase [Bisgaardia hudsonensis]
MKYKNNHSVLVIIYAESTQRVLMLQRRDDPTFWQSVTGSIENDETPYDTAFREVREETGIDILAEKLPLFDCKEKIEFEIFPHFRYKYAPNVTHCVEHWFLLALPEEREPILVEHIDYQWLSTKEASSLTKSWNNRLAIEKYLLS